MGETVGNIWGDSGCDKLPGAGSPMASAASDVCNEVEPLLGCAVLAAAVPQEMGTLLLAMALGCSDGALEHVMSGCGEGDVATCDMPGGLSHGCTRASVAERRSLGSSFSNAVCQGSGNRGSRSQKRSFSPGHGTAHQKADESLVLFDIKQRGQICLHGQQLVGT